MRWRRIGKIACVASLLLMLLSAGTFATHLRGGEITVKNLQCGQGYEVTVTLYTNTQTNARPGGGILAFGDGTQLVLPELLNQVIDAQYGIAKAVFTVVHNYDPGTFTIGYSEANRNGGILNFQNSVNTPFYIVSQLVVDPTLNCNNPITFTIAPIDKACKGIAFSHNPGAKDIDGDSISFELYVPRRTATQVVTGYQLPNAIAFYGGLNYLHSNESASGPPIFSLDAITGNLIWDAPGSVGQYEVAMKVTEWKKYNGVFRSMGFVERDIQIIVEDCHDARPYLDVPVDVCVTPGDHLSSIIKGYDADFDLVKIEVFTSDNFQSSAPVGVYSGLSQSTLAPSDTAHVRLDWNITCDLVRDQPYIIVFKITDFPANGIRLSTFKTWKVTVIGAAPEFNGVTLDLAEKSLRIDWKPYACSNAPVMEVWRRADNALTSIDNCTRGLSRAMGFVKIASVTGAGFYVDTDLNPGSKYCYRLLAVYKSPYTSVSRPSVETCVGPIKVYAPVVTKVSVVKTNKVQGEVRVTWTSPYQINTSQFPKPYEYELYRTTDGTTFTKATVQRLTDTTYVDPGLNTTAVDYGYKIVVYAPSGLTHQNPVDTSALAFFPRLTQQSGGTSIYLQWNAKVPWTNQSQKYPWHYIYRADVGAFSLIDSVDVNASTLDDGFDYTDKGTYKSQPLAQNIVYRYKVSTRGVYGNIKLDPLINDSNEVEGWIKDLSPPCAALLSIDKTDCENFIKSSACDITEYRNQLTWDYPSGCGNDVASYQILFMGPGESGYTQVATTDELSYSHELVNSFSGCYKIIAVDRSGNTSGESEPVCNENCRNFFIPNVFTPANQDGLNDVFPGVSGGQLKDPLKCPRFVTHVDIRIINRWGKEVFSMSAPFDQDMTEWKGQDENGNELPAGVYYYEANIEYSAIEEALKKQKLKGWVNLIR
ncbi:MAG TPA: gliding motility-associated C-terminal domain-containing protein [Cyclobacteriaceae bacterium]|nr:gliding motility-associated C-terminal domain-containing protein [Cyclobacteriaceae bacterium]